MTLSCSCDHEPDAGSVCWHWANDYSELKTKRARKCCSCGNRIDVGEIVAAYAQYKVPDSEIELRIYGEDDWNGPPRATAYHCEECADLCFSLLELGFCISIFDEMKVLVKEYSETYGPTTPDRE